VNIISQFVTVNSKKMEILELGNKGTPVVILTGMGYSFYEWYEVTKYLAQSNRVIMFHRPGLGLSEIGSEIRDTKAVVNELNTLLQELKIFEPILLVGHSYGGLCVQHYAKVFPENVAGMVLVDSTSVDLKELDELELPVIDEDESDEVWLKKCYSYSLMKQEELKELVNPSLTDKQKELPLDVQQQLINFQVNPSLYKAMYLEISNWKMDADVIRNLEDLVEIVIGRDKEYNIKLGTMEGFPEREMRVLEDKWEELIMKQAKLSKNSVLIFAEESSHSIHIDRPDIIVTAIDNLIQNTSKADSKS